MVTHSADCVFCQILAGKKYQPLVYTDALCSAFMDINQPNPYHVLVVPNTHVETIYELDAAQSAAIFQVGARIAQAIRVVSNCHGMNLYNNNGRAAGQSVDHFHLHLMPRFKGDLPKMTMLLMGRRTLKSREVLDQWADRLKSQLDQFAQ